MLPETGWLAEEDTQHLPALDTELPGGLSLVYRDGNSDILWPANQAWPVFRSHLINSFIIRQVGYGPNFGRTFVLLLNQQNVFSVLLLDGFTPPNIAQEIFDFTLSPLDACILPDFEAVDTVFGDPATGTAVPSTQVGGEDVVFEKFISSTPTWEGACGKSD